MVNKFERKEHTLFAKKKTPENQGIELSIHKGIKLASPFLLWKYSQLTNKGSGLSSGWRAGFTSNGLEYS